MKRFASPSWHCCADNRNPYGSRLTGDGEVPFIRHALVNYCPNDLGELHITARNKL